MSDDLSHWLEMLDSPSLEARRQAAESLARMGPGAARAAVQLVRAAGDEDETVREWVVSALEGLGAADPGDLCELGQLLMSQNRDVAYWAATLLGRMKQSGEAAVPLLAGALSSHPDMAVRQRAAWALGTIGPAARAATAVLQEAARSTDRRLARVAGEALKQLGTG